MKAVILLLLANAAMAQCGPPTPGQPHVCLTWTAAVQPPTVAGYNVCRGTVSKGEDCSNPLNTSPLTGTSFYDTNVAIGTTYYYDVVSVGTDGSLSVPSQEIFAVCHLITEPAPLHKVIRCTEEFVQ